MKKLLFLSALLLCNAMSASTNDEAMPNLNDVKKELQQCHNDIIKCQQDLLDITQTNIAILTVAIQGTTCILGKMLWSFPVVSRSLAALRTELATLTGVAAPTTLLNPLVLPIAGSQAITGVHAYLYTKNTEKMIQNSYVKHGDWAANNIKQGLINAFDGSSW